MLPKSCTSVKDHTGILHTANVSLIVTVIGYTLKKRNGWMRNGKTARGTCYAHIIEINLFVDRFITSWMISEPSSANVRIANEGGISSLQKRNNFQLGKLRNFITDYYISCSHNAQMKFRSRSSGESR